MKFIIFNLSEVTKFELSSSATLQNGNMNAKSLQDIISLDPSARIEVPLNVIDNVETISPKYVLFAFTACRD